MLTRYVKPGEKVELQTMERSILGSVSDKKAYTSKVYDVISDEQIEILMPMEKTKLILLPVDGEYDVCFYTKQGLFQCYVRIIDRYKSDNTFILLCEPTSNLRKYQRREYYRFSCILNMDSRELVEEELEAMEKNELVFQPGLPLQKSVIVDISGGGVRFVSNYRYEKETIIYLTYKLMIAGKEKTYEIAGKILASKPIENRPGEFEHRLQYMNINNMEREEIIRYIFEEERKNRRKENGM
ncbi:MAG: flagellar brake protein [Lachnospiraceae bacterium]|nr:flagellar brake protein [Lachnospiraceae bacterium]